MGRKVRQNGIITIYACIAEDFETVKQIDYKNCLKSRELHQCKDRQFYALSSLHCAHVYFNLPPSSWGTFNKPLHAMAGKYVRMPV